MPFLRALLLYNSPTVPSPRKHSIFGLDAHGLDKCFWTVTRSGGEKVTPATFAPAIGRLGVGFLGTAATPTFYMRQNH